MKQKDVQELLVGASVGFKRSTDSEMILATVIQNGPRLAPVIPAPDELDSEGKPILTEGEPIPHMNDLLVIQLEAGPATVSWEPVNYPNGIPELMLPDVELPIPPNPEQPLPPEEELPEEGPPPMRPLPNPPKIPPPPKSALL